MKRKTLSKILFWTGFAMFFLGLGMISRYDIINKIPLLLKILLVFIIAAIFARFFYPDRKKFLKK
jgi:hypothetical protein